MNRCKCKTINPAIKIIKRCYPRNNLRNNDRSHTNSSLSGKTSLIALGFFLFSISFGFPLSFPSLLWIQGDSFMAEWTVEPDSRERDPWPRHDPWSWGKSFPRSLSHSNRLSEGEIMGRWDLCPREGEDQGIGDLGPREKGGRSGRAGKS